MAWLWNGADWVSTASFRTNVIDKDTQQGPTKTLIWRQQAEFLSKQVRMPASTCGSPSAR